MTNLPLDRLHSLRPFTHLGSATLAMLTVGLMIATAPLPDAMAAEGDKPTGLEVAKDSDKAQRADSEYNVMTMTLENSRGQQRIRTIEGYSHELSEDEEHRFAKFLKPSDVKDTTLLTYDYREEDDDIWLYLPALKKVKRILSSNKTDYFMGSDFTYWDMENLDFTNWTYVLTGEETIDGVDCWIVEATPANDEEKKESGYEKTVSWISKKDHLPRRVDFHDLKGRHAKRLTTADIRPTSDTDPRPRAHKLTMENYVTKHKTVLVMEKLTLDVPVDEEIFSQRNMRQ